MRSRWMARISVAAAVTALFAATMPAPAFASGTPPAAPVLVSPATGATAPPATPLTVQASDPDDAMPLIKCGAERSSEVGIRRGVGQKRAQGPCLRGDGSSSRVVLVNIVDADSIWHNNDASGSLLALQFRDLQPGPLNFELSLLEINGRFPDFRIQLLLRLAKHE